MVAKHQQPIAVLGAGSWGTALALYLSRLGQEVRLWTIEPEHVLEMEKDHENRRYMPGHHFPDTLHPTGDLAAAVKDADAVLIAVPSVGFRNIISLLKPLLNSSARVISVTKGLDLETGQLLHDVAQELLGTNHPYAVLSGPSFAREVSAGLPTAVVIATQDEKFSKDLLERFNSQIFRIYISTDLIGVEVGGVVKNVIAIATGISDGMGFGTNARCALITRGLAEITRLGLALGGHQETFTGLAGLGDLVLTCTDDQSRNRRFGIALGKGKKPNDAEREIGQVVEGKRNAELVVQLAKKHHVEMPISEAVWDVIKGELTPMDAMKQLLSREPKPE